MTNAGSPEQAWLPAALNGGHAYRDRASAAAPSVLGFYAERYTHSDRQVWSERLAAGEIWRNGQPLLADAPLAAGDRLVWHRPPWQEAAVPMLSEASIVFDDGDLLVLNKPSGLPVLPAGGFLNHTLLAQLKSWAPEARPVHRLGRFTSGLLVCARRAESRAWLSAQLRESTKEAQPVGEVTGCSQRVCRKLYRTLIKPLPADWEIGETHAITIAIGRRSHPMLGQVWCAVDPHDPSALRSLSHFTLLERRVDTCLVEVAIDTGRPHQIRIHAAAIGSPLLGDPLYESGGLANSQALPGDGGYFLHASSIRLRRRHGDIINICALSPSHLCHLMGQAVGSQKDIPCLYGIL